MATSFTVFSKTEDLDLSQIFNVGQQSNLDDFVVFNIYYDALVNCDITAVVEYLNKRLIATYDVIGDFCAAYSWSGCPPYLEVVIPHHDATNRQLRDASNTDLPHLRCHLRLGDNTEEEWLVVFLLLRLTEHFNDISIIVFDNDGQFLLMEAAFHIPSSVDPENAENRVFLRHGALHLIPPTSTKRVSLTVRDALRALLASDARYCAKRSAQASIRRRTEQHQAIYDAWLSSTKTLAAEMPRLSSATLCAPYSCSAVVPLPIAILLQKYPQLLTIALDYLPPKEHMSSGRHVKSNNDPHFNFQDATALASIVRVTFSRCQYVRLQQLRFILPMHFTLSHWKTPPKPTALSDLELRAAMILGSKLCLGLQSAYRANPQGWDAIVSFFWDNPLEGRDDSKSRLRRFVHWVSSEAPLTASGGKLCYKKQSNCPLQWLQLDKDITLNKDISYLRFSQLYYKAHREATFLTNSSNVFTQISAPVLKNDDASWLELTADDVDALIEERTKEDGFSALHTERQATSTQNDKLSDADNDKLTFSNFRDVMDRVSGLWGIEHLYDRPSNPAKTASQGFFSNFSGNIKDLFNSFAKDQQTFSSSDASSDSGGSASSMLDDSVGADDIGVTQIRKNIYLSAVPDSPAEPLYTTADAMEAMDAELASMVTEQKSSGEINALHTTVPFRSTITSEAELENAFCNNLKRAQKEEFFLEPGPATLLLKGLSEYSALRAPQSQKRST